MEFDDITTQHSLQFGYVAGTNGLLIIKGGAGGSIYGYKNKYLTMAERVKEKYGFAVMVSENPVDIEPEENMRATMEMAYDYIESFPKGIPVYYFGISKGAHYAATFAYQYPWVTRWMALNMPIIVNWHKIKRGLEQLPMEQSMTIVFGDQDPCFRYAGMVDTLKKRNVRKITIENEDHYFSKSMEDFLQLPERYLFEMKD